MKKIKIYLIARISEDAHSWNNLISGKLSSELFEVFKPHEHNPWNHKHETFSREVFDVDLGAIKKSHIGLCLPEFGKDCSWECGWFSNSKKPLVAFVENQTNWLRDWMIKGGIDYVITNKKSTYEKLIGDPILKCRQIILIDDMDALGVELKNIYEKHYKNKIFGHILNLRPYSWIDMILTGYLAKFSITKELIFEIKDLYWIMGILMLWFFFNAMLEMKHGYKYRQKVSVIFPVVYFLSVLIIGITNQPLSVFFILISSLLVLIYLQKNKNLLLGILSSPVRGLIHAAYFLFVLMFFSTSLNKESIAIAGMLFLIYTARAIIGDMRDIKQNARSNKKTIPVIFGLNNSKLIVILLLILSINIELLQFGSFLAISPLILFGLGLLINEYGYALHQLVISITSFVSINLIALFTNQSIIFFNLIFFGIWLNMIFYPLLERKSNPKFVEQIR